MTNPRTRAATAPAETVIISVSRVNGAGATFLSGDKSVLASSSLLNCNFFSCSLSSTELITVPELYLLLYFADADDDDEVGAASDVS